MKYPMLILALCFIMAGSLGGHQAMAEADYDAPAETEEEPQREPLNVEEGEPANEYETQGGEDDGQQYEDPE